MQESLFLIAQTTKGGSGSNILLMYLVIGVIFYFIVFSPMRKRQKQTQEMLSNLKKGDRVITNGGIYGEVVAVEQQVVYLRIAEKLKIKVAKSAIAGFEKQGEGEKE